MSRRCMWAVARTGLTGEQFEMSAGPPDGSDHLIRVGLDFAAAGAVAASFLQWLPPISAILGIIWFLIQIFESRTVRHFLERWRANRKAKRLHRLRIKEAAIRSAIASLDGDAK